MLMRKLKKVLRVLAVIFLLVVTALVALPLWFPWLLRPVLQAYNVRFGTYQREGYSRLAVTDVLFTNATVKFTAKQVEVFQPAGWLWKLWKHDGQAEFANVSGWQLDVFRSEPRQTNARPAEVIARFERVVTPLEKWIPSVAFTNGQAHFGEVNLPIPFSKWHGGIVTGRIVSPQLSQEAAVRVNLSGSPKRLVVSTQPSGVAAEFEVRCEPPVVTVAGQVSWNTNQLNIEARLRDRWVPDLATVRADKLVLPASLLDLKGYEDLLGSFSARWQTNQFSVDLTASANPARRSSNTAQFFPPVKTIIHATGTTNSIHIEQAEVSLPWLKAMLSHDAEIDFAGRLVSPTAALNVDIDLNQQHLVNARGRLVGEALLTRSTNRYPLVTFNLRSDAFAGYGVQVQQLNLTGNLDWPRLALDPAEIRFEEGGVATAKAQVDLAERSIQSGHIEAKGPVSRQFVPPSISCSNLVLVADFKGPLEKLAHSGRVEIDGLATPRLVPLRAMAKWRGHIADLDQIEIGITGAQSTLELSGSGQVTTNAATVHLKALTLGQSNQTLLTLQRAVDLVVQKTGKRWLTEVGRIDLRGAGRALSFNGKFASPAESSFALVATNLDTGLARQLYMGDLPVVRLDQLDVRGGFTNGPLDFVLRGSGSVALDGADRIALKVNGSGDRSGIALEELQLLGKMGAVVSARGFLPVRINPAQRTNLIEIDAAQPVDLRIDSLPNKAFWDAVASIIGARLQEPEVHMVVSGTLNDPKGHITADASAIQLLSKDRRELPSLTSFRAAVTLDERSIRADRLDLLVEGQPVSVTATLPLQPNFQNNLKEVLNWRKASGHIVARDVELAPFARFVPDVLAPQGRIDLDAAFSLNFQLTGLLALTNAATRPLPGTGPLTEIQARLRFDRRRLEIQNVQGRLGGQPVAVIGSADFAQWTTDNLPRFELKLLGDNVPLARNPDAIIRGDLNVVISNLTNTPPLISGEVRLRDSFFLGDLKQLLPGKVATPKRRPPYFSVEALPFAMWKTDVRVDGTDFLNVRSPLFRGRLSAEWRVTGTLHDPLALGDARMSSGIIEFPFANFRVTQGFVTLTSDDPYRPHLLVTATSRAFGYDLQMNMHGPADQPFIEFTSTPPLTSEQVILMVTAGEVPKKTFQFSSQQRAQKFALFLGKSLLSKFSTDGTGGAERLSITTGEEISEKGRETYAAEYKLSDDWSIVAEYDRFGGLNAGLKWRVYSR